jgi:hypothetical protein
MVPPCFSISSLHIINPNPVPDSFAVPSVECWVSILKSFTKSSSRIPTPLSDTVTAINSPSAFADILISPPYPVNFTALLIKFWSVE